MGDFVLLPSMRQGGRDVEMTKKPYMPVYFELESVPIEAALKEAIRCNRGIIIKIKPKLRKGMSQC